MANSIHAFFTDAVLQSKMRNPPYFHPVVHLDKNEMPVDVPENLKFRVVEDLLQQCWNRYPPANAFETEQIIGDWIGVRGSQIVVAPGAANIIVSLLSYFALSHKPITIVQPSYSLFSYYCNTYGINFQPWYLDSQLQYDLEMFPQQEFGSVVFIVSPNNPVGNVIHQEQIEMLLQLNPNSMFVVDEVYVEFMGEGLVGLVDKYHNLMLLRSLSKSMASAGIRLGYLIANDDFTGQVRKLVLSFSLNLFSLAFVKIALKDPVWKQQIQINIQSMIKERERVFSVLKCFETRGIKVWPSEGNFLMITFLQSDFFEMMLEFCRKSDVAILDVSKMPKLANSVRISIGLPVENQKLIEILESVLSRNG